MSRAPTSHYNPMNQKYPLNSVLGDLTVFCVLAQNSLRRGHNDALEIFHNERWGYVCDDSFDSLDADVACRQLGYPNATDFRIRIEVLNDFFWLDNLNCNGNELSLDDCASNNFGLENCYAREGVVVECSPHCELFVCLFVYLFVCLFVRLFTRLYIYLFVFCVCENILFR